MADTKISALGAVDAVAAGDKVAIADASDLTVSKSATMTQIATHLQGIPGAHYVHVSKSSGASTTGANTTPIDVSGAVFTYETNSTYRIWVMGRINSSAATTGIGVQFNLSSAVTAIDSFTIHNLAVATVAGQSSIADDASQGVTTGVPAGPLDVPFVTNCLLVTGANTGTCQLRFRSETTAVTELMAGTTMVVEKLI